MRVITNNPILVNSKRVEPNDMYVNLDAATVQAAAKGGKTVPGKTKRGDGKVWDKTKGAWVKAQDSGLLSSLGTMFGVNQAQTYPDQAYIEPTDPNANQPMSSGLKTGLIIGGVVIAAVGIYFLVRNKKSGK